MKTVMRANKQLRIPDDQLAAMMKQGYVQIDEKTGKPIEAAPGEQDLKKENAKLRKENKDLTAQIKELEARIKELEPAKP